MKWKILFLLFAGLIVRLLLVPQHGYEGDIVFWKTWALAAYDKGIVWMANNTSYNYPAGYGLILWLIGQTYALFADIHNSVLFSDPGNYLFLLLAKMPSIVADLISAGLIYSILLSIKLINFIKIRKKQDVSPITSHLPLIFAAAYLFHPVILFDGAWWGQVDSIGIASSLACLYLLMKQRPYWAAVVLAGGFMLKLQVMILLPLFFVFVWRAYRWKTMVKTIGIWAATCLVVSFPFLLSNNLSRVYDLILLNSDYFPWLSLRADNFWTLYSNGAGITTSDKILAIGILNAKTLGLLLFSAVYLLCLGLIVRSDKLGLPPSRSTKENILPLLFAFILASFAFYLFPTQIHERYSFPVVALGLPCLFCFLNKKMFGWILAGYCLFSFSALVSYNNSLTLSYPVNGLSFLAFLNSPTTPVVASVFNLLIFITIFIYLLRIMPKIWIIGSFCLVFCGVIFVNLPYYFHQSLPLTRLKPTNVQFQFQYPQFDRSLNSYLGPKAWSFLSNNYYFYRKGISTNATTLTSYDLAGRFEWFTSDYGVDTDAGPKASVGFEIWTDGQKIFSSEKMGKADLPKSIKVPVKGVKNLTLIVNDAGDGNTDDHGDWLEPVLIK